jgi:anti-sigma B factor antagonist
MTDAPVLDPDITAVRCHRVPNGVSIELVGEIDIETAPRLQAAIDWIAAGGPADVTVDLSRTRFLDSTALRFFVRLRKLVVAGGGTMTLTGASNGVARTLHQSGLDRILNVAPLPAPLT